MPDEWTKDSWKVLWPASSPSLQRGKLQAPTHTDSLGRHAGSTPAWQLTANCMQRFHSMCKFCQGPSRAFGQSNEGASLRQSHIPCSALTCSDAYTFLSGDQKRKNKKEEKKNLKWYILATLLDWLFARSLSIPKWPFHSFCNNARTRTLWIPFPRLLCQPAAKSCR